MTGRRKRHKKLKYLILLLFILAVLLPAARYAPKTVYPVKYKELVLEFSDKYKIDPYLVFAMVKVESNFKADALSSKNARGLMQISETTGKWGADALKLDNFNAESLFDPKTNISIGCWYMNNLLKEFGGDTELALAAYNGGSGNVNEWLRDPRLSSSGKNLDRIPFKETENYLKRVKDTRAIYKKLYENGF